MAAFASGLPDRPDGKSATGRPAAGPATTILVTAWTARNEPIAQARLQLRNAVTGRVETTGIANMTGQLSFENVEGGSYVVELLSESGKVQVVGQVFTITQGETVATFVRLASKVPWFAAFFSNSMTAVSAAAATGGIAAIAPVARPVSGNQ